jgi:hypothetical protein
MFNPVHFVYSLLYGFYCFFMSSNEFLSFVMPVIAEIAIPQLETAELLLVVYILSISSFLVLPSFLFLFLVDVLYCKACLSLKRPRLSE